MAAGEGVCCCVTVTVWLAVSPAVSVAVTLMMFCPATKSTLALKPPAPRMIFDAVLPVGGGALIAGDKLRNALLIKGARVHWSEDPITENARGLFKWAMKHCGAQND